MTKVDPLSLTIFNVVVNSVVCHYILLVSVGTRGQYGWGIEVLHSATFLYADDGLVASTDLVWLQGTFDPMTVLSDRGAACLAEIDFGTTSSSTKTTSNPKCARNINHFVPILYSRLLV